MITPSSSSTSKDSEVRTTKPSEEEDATEEINLDDLDICTHPDSLGYMCHTCSYKRWRTGFDAVKTRVEKKVEVVTSDNKDAVKAGETPEQSAEAADILKNVNWQQVFSFAGINV